ncbi:hypothetical protein Hanom_Chr06g00500541 [Helianthus anomalus]
MLNDKYWYKFPRFLQMILETKYPKLPVIVKTYDVKIMNHMVFSLLNQKSRENVGVNYQNKKPLKKFAPAGTIESVENVDVTGIESEEDVAEDRMADDDEVSENVSEDETETEVNAESLIAETQNVGEPVNVSHPHVEPVATANADTEDAQEDPTADLPPRKRSRRDPRININDNAEVGTTTESTMHVTTTRPPIHYTPSELNPRIVDFIQNERSAMYIPAPRPGEGSASGPSDADVIRVAELLQAAAREVEAAAKSIQEETHEAANSSNSDDLFEENETTILMCRITILEEDKIFKDAQIASLMEELVVKNQKINEQETNLGALSAVMMDMKQKLEGYFPKEFADPPTETTAEERERERREHEEAIDRYIANPPRTTNQRPRKKMVVMRTMGAEQFGDKPDRYVVTTEQAKHGNRFGFHS